MGPGATIRGGASTARALQFTFLGRVALEAPERPGPVEIRGTQPALVLAYLVLERPRGPVTHHMGRLALLRDDRGHAEKLLRRAVEQSECFRAPRFAARSQAQLDQLG